MATSNSQKNRNEVEEISLNLVNFILYASIFDTDFDTDSVVKSGGSRK